MSANHKTVHQIVDAATDEQVRAWWPAISAGGAWPADMPIPLEAYQAFWHSLQKRYLNLPFKP